MLDALDRAQVRGMRHADIIDMEELDRVAGISLYRFKLTFADQGKSVTIALTERNGLGEETIKGKS